MLKVLRASMLFSSVAVVSVAQGAEFEVHPSIAVNQEYTDNVFETGINRVSDYITRALPGITMSYKAPALTGTVNYQFDYRHYAKNSRKDELTHTLGAKAYLVAIKDFLYLDVVDDYQRVSLDVARNVSSESLFFNQSDRNVVTASPYIILHPTDRTAVKTGYRFIDTRYFSSSAINKIDHIGFAEVTHSLSKRLDLTASYTFTKEQAVINNFDQHLASGGFRYEYVDKSFIFAYGGNSWTNYKSGQNLNSVYWNAGITHVLDTVTASVTTGKRYVEDPLLNIAQETFVNGVIEKRFTKGLISLSPVYSEFKQPQSSSLQTRKYGATVQGQYEFTPGLSGNLAFTAEKYEQPQLSSYTRRFLVTSGLSYLVADQLTLSLFYNYADYSSPGIAADNRHVNRAMIEIKKVF